MSKVIPRASSWAYLLDYAKKKLWTLQYYWAIGNLTTEAVCSWGPSAILCLPRVCLAWITNLSSHSVVARAYSSIWCLHSIDGSILCKTGNSSHPRDCLNLGRHFQAPSTVHRLRHWAAHPGLFHDFLQAFLHQLCFYRKLIRNQHKQNEVVTDNIDSVRHSQSN